MYIHVYDKSLFYYKSAYEDLVCKADPDNGILTAFKCLSDFIGCQLLAFTSPSQFWWITYMLARKVLQNPDLCGRMIWPMSVYECVLYASTNNL